MHSIPITYLIHAFRASSTSSSEGEREEEDDEELPLPPPADSIPLQAAAAQVGSATTSGGTTNEAMQPTIPAPATATTEIAGGVKAADSSSWRGPALFGRSPFPIRASDEKQRQHHFPSMAPPVSTESQNPGFGWAAATGGWALAQGRVPSPSASSPLRISQRPTSMQQQQTVTQQMADRYGGVGGFDASSGTGNKAILHSSAWMSPPRRAPLPPPLPPIFPGPFIPAMMTATASRTTFPLAERDYQLWTSEAPLSPPAAFGAVRNIPIMRRFDDREPARSRSPPSLSDNFFVGVRPSSETAASRKYLINLPAHYAPSKSAATGFGFGGI